ncbi:Cap15 family CBASS effector [Kosakonia cowanii]|uniref:Cap15 family cyclic dinucleotide receptor domain-containing protein n=1 Tax=Kosakonia cowanii TaxID=208223 RepID=UPI003EE452C9
MKSHEYIVICGFNRSRVGKIIGGVSSVLSALIIYVVLTILQHYSFFDYQSVLPPSISSLISAGGIYIGLYYLFNSRWWKSPKISRLLNVPDLSGEWDCQGQGKNMAGDEFQWSAVIKIFQSWDKVHIRMDTLQSGSDSVAASIVYDEGVGYRLIYNYRNDPRINETHLNSHMGFAEFTFSQDMKSADGEYFNGRGRNTFGTMKIVRK